MATIAAMITDLCKRAGLDSSLVDVSLVTSDNLLPVSDPGGYVINRPTQAVAALQEIMKAFFIDACESDGKLKFVPRAAPQSNPAIPEFDLGLEADQAELQPQQGQEQDLPESVTVLFVNAQLDYQQGKQLKARNPRILTIGTRSEGILSLPFTLLATEARQIAEVALYSAWDNRVSFQMNLWRVFWALLDPTDWIQFTYQGSLYTMRILSASVAPGGAVAIEGVRDDQRNYNSLAVGAQNLAFASSGFKLLAPTVLFLLDIPLLRDPDANVGGSGFYFALTSGDITPGDWVGASLYESSDDAAFNLLQSSSVAAGFGYATTVLAAPRSPWTWDTANTLTIQLVRGTIAGDTDLNVFNGSNALLVGSEIIQFATAVENMDGTYTLSRLLRGRRGTEWACGSHSTGEQVILLSEGGVLHQAENLAVVGHLRYYRGVTLGADMSAAPDVDQTLTGADRKPYAPVHILGSRDGSNNLTITWIRRTRIGWLNLAQDPVPLSEDSELYDVDILSGLTVMRTIANLTSPTASYTAAQQTTDFGSPQSAISVNVYQKSAQVGRGFTGSATV